MKINWCLFFFSIEHDAAGWYLGFLLVFYTLLKALCQAFLSVFFDLSLICTNFSCTWILDMSSVIDLHPLKLVCLEITFTLAFQSLFSILTSVFFCFFCCCFYSFILPNVYKFEPWKFHCFKNCFFIIFSRTSTPTVCLVYTLFFSPPGILDMMSNLLTIWLSLQYLLFHLYIIY